MKDEPETTLDMPALTVSQRKALVELLQATGQQLARGISFHGTLHKNLVHKDLVIVIGDRSMVFGLSDYGRQVAQVVQEQEIARSARRLTADAVRTMRQADEDVRTPPPARPSYVSQPVGSRSLAAISAHSRQVDEIMTWLRNPARQVRQQQLRSCGHGNTCSQCGEREKDARSLELALITLAGEVDLLKQQLGYKEMDLRRSHGAVQALLGAVQSAVGIDRAELTD